MFLRVCSILHKLFLSYRLTIPVLALQMFAGNCTDQVEFYDSPDDYNYKRAVTWSIVMAYLSHMHPAFETVFSIEAINEPERDASKTPGLDRCKDSNLYLVLVIINFW